MHRIATVNGETWNDDSYDSHSQICEMWNNDGVCRSFDELLSIRGIMLTHHPLRDYASKEGRIVHIFLWICARDIRVWYILFNYNIPRARMSDCERIRTKFRAYCEFFHYARSLTRLNPPPSSEKSSFERTTANKYIIRQRRNGNTPSRIPRLINCCLSRTTWSTPGHYHANSRLPVLYLCPLLLTLRYRCYYLTALDYVKLELIPATVIRPNNVPLNSTLSHICTRHVQLNSNAKVYWH